MKKSDFIIFIFTLIAIIYSGCTNPFAPKYDENAPDNSSVITDLKTIEGLFQNFQYAYTFKDTTIYGEIIPHDFVFTYRDYEAGFDVSWGRDEEMKTTYGLFNNSQNLNLIWNNIVISSEDSVTATATIVRGFNLTITFNPTDVIRIDGRVNLLLTKNASTEKWAITRWIDESNF